MSESAAGGSAGAALTRSPGATRGSRVSPFLIRKSEMNLSGLPRLSNGRYPSEIPDTS